MKCGILLLILNFIWISLVFPLRPSCSVPGSRLEYYIAFVFMTLQSSLIQDSFSVFLWFSWPWQSWAALARYFVEIPPVGLFWYFSYNLTGIMSLRDKCHRNTVPFSSHHKKDWVNASVFIDENLLFIYSYIKTTI